MPTPDTLDRINHEIMMEQLKAEQTKERDAHGWCAAEMPKYRSHKVVHALKIKSIAFDRDAAQRENRETDGGAVITPAEPAYAPFKVDHAYVSKNDPKAGGYFVVYADGYKSWSPAGAFESGYTRI